MQAIYGWETTALILDLFQAAVRSSRRKRSQYVITLREEVAGLQRRRREAQEERALLRQLTLLWQRLCDEVEAEIQEGVRRQLGIQVRKQLRQKMEIGVA